MSEILDSFKEVVRNRISNSIYGVLFLSWLIFHWNFIFSILFLSEDNILSQTGMLKNEYLIARYFNPINIYTWVSWFAPFILTYIIVWHLPNWVLLKAHRKSEDYEVEKKLITLLNQRKIEQEQTRLQEQKTKTVTATSKQVLEKKKIEKADPTQVWDLDYERLKNLSFGYKLNQIIESIYKRRGDIVQRGDFGIKTEFEISEDILAFVHSNGMVLINEKENKISLTDKGKYIINKYLEDPHKPIEIPF